MAGSQRSSHNKSRFGQNSGGPTKASGTFASQSVHASCALQELHVRNAQENVKPNRGTSRTPHRCPGVPSSGRYLLRTHILTASKHSSQSPFRPGYDKKSHFVPTTRNRGEVGGSFAYC